MKCFVIFFSVFLLFWKFFNIANGWNCVRFPESWTGRVDTFIYARSGRGIDLVFFFSIIFLAIKSSEFGVSTKTGTPKSANSRRCAFIITRFNKSPSRRVRRTWRPVRWTVRPLFGTYTWASLIRIECIMCTRKSRNMFLKICVYASKSVEFVVK